MTSLDLLIYVTTAAVILAIIGIIGMLVDLYGDYLHTFLSRIMDRDDESLGQRIEELDDQEDFCGTASANELEQEMNDVWKELTTNNEGNLYVKATIDPKWTDVNGLVVEVTQPDGEKTVINEGEFGMDFLSDKFKEGDKKVANGEISCNLDNPEDCENCGS